MLKKLIKSPNNDPLAFVRIACCFFRGKAAAVGGGMQQPLSTNTGK
jgi:hypothetical protein